MEYISIVTDFDQKLDSLLEEVQDSAYWKSFIALPNQKKLDAIKWVFRDIGAYQAQVNHAVFEAVGRHGKHVEEQEFVRELIAVQIEEVGHGAMALNDFLILGGSHHELSDYPSPEAMAVIALVRHVGAELPPLCHLGFMYFFEKFTTLITGVLAPILEDAGYPHDRLEFIRAHAEEDERHAQMLAELIDTAVTRYPGSADSIRYGFDCFGRVYPHPLWSQAVNRVTELEEEYV